MNKRLNDTAALVHTPFGGDENTREHHTREVRKIDNGYVTREHHDDGLGFISQETYSAEHPDAGAPGVLKNDHSAMKKAVDHLNRR